MQNNFWGGAGPSLIDVAITDFNDDFNLMRAPYSPVLGEAPVSAYPFVVDVVLANTEGTSSPGNRFGAETTQWTVTFNRDMDTTKQPFVSFGPAEPFTDFSVPGALG